MALEFYCLMLMVVCKHQAIKTKYDVNDNIVNDCIFKNYRFFMMIDIE